MLPKMMLDFLMEVWENPVVEMSEERWNYVEYLKIFGFLAYRMGNSISDEPNQIIVVDEMKDRFLFPVKKLEKDQKSNCLFMRNGKRLLPDICIIMVS